MDAVGGTGLQLNSQFAPPCPSFSKVRGVPAIYLTDAEGNPFYSTSGYGGQKADEWVEQMVAKTGIPKALAKA